jgi:putative lipoprotein (rSAM/lipoprotein system)
MKKLRRIFSNTLKCISFTAVAFIFQACYGMRMPYEYYTDFPIDGYVKAKSSNQAIKGIRVSVEKPNYAEQDSVFYEELPDFLTYTDENGKFSLFFSGEAYAYSNHDGNLILKFEDVDGMENGKFSDTTKVIEMYGMAGVTVNMVMEDAE